MLCPVCKGSGSLVTFEGGIRWWNCPACWDAGVLIQYGPKMWIRRRKKNVRNK